MEEVRTQIKDIKNHLLTFGMISPLQALDLYGVYRLSARIWDLRHGREPMNIRTETRAYKGADGRRKQSAVYVLER